MPTLDVKFQKCGFFYILTIFFRLFWSETEQWNFMFMDIQIKFYNNWFKGLQPRNIVLGHLGSESRQKNYKFTHSKNTKNSRNSRSNVAHSLGLKLDFIMKIIRFETLFFIYSNIFLIFGQKMSFRGFSFSIDADTWCKFPKMCDFPIF